MPHRTKVTFGSRKSKLAMWQTELVVNELKALAPEIECEIVKFDTAGDRNLDRPLPEIGGKGLFTAELDFAIHSQDIAAAVHSLKDLPTAIESGMEVLPILKREDPRDVLICRAAGGLADLPQGAVVGTSSPRRASQVMSLRDDLIIKPIRGNVQTRIAKVESGEYDAAVLAAAGVIRIGLVDKITEWFGFDQMLPAPGQGCIAATFRASDVETRELLERLVHDDSNKAVAAERFLLEFLGGGCSAPIGAYAQVVTDEGNSNGRLIRLTVRVTSPDGKAALTDSESGNDPRIVAKSLATRLLANGADSILKTEAAQSATALLSRSSLNGKRVAITRAKCQAKGLADELRRFNATPVELPMIEFRQTTDADEAAAVFAEIGNYDWLIFSSANGVRFFFDLLPGEPVLTDCQVACVGHKTARFLESRFRAPDFVPDNFTGERLAKQIPILPDSKILLPGPKVASPILIDGLIARGAKVRLWSIYETTAVNCRQKLTRSFNEGLDAITFASPSAVSSFCEQFPEFSQYIDDCVVACIGPITSERAFSHGLGADVVPCEHTIEGLVAALMSKFEANKTKNYH